MIEIKKHLKDIDRIDLDNSDRRKYLRLDRNEGIIPPDKYAIQMATNDQYDTITMYPEYVRLKHKLAKRVGVGDNNVIINNGSDGVIKNIFETYINPKDNVLLTDPTFSMYPIYCKMFQAKFLPFVEYTSLKSFPESSFLESLNKDIKMAVIINPNNPTGYTVSEKYLKQVLKKAQDTGTLVVIDEAYSFHSIMAKHVKTYDNLIVIRTFSKFLGLPSIRLGFGLSNPDIVNDLRKMQKTFPVNGMAVSIVNTLLDSPYVFEDMYNEFLKGRNFLINKLESEGISYCCGDGNFILIKTSIGIVERLKENMILVRGNFDQDIFRGYIRVTIGKKKDMEQFWSAFLGVKNEKN